MREPRPEDFDPKAAMKLNRSPEPINLSGIVPLKPKADSPVFIAPIRETPEVPKFVSSELPKSPTSELPNFRSYKVRNFDELRRLDTRITGEQKRFLDDLEEDIRQTMPEGERDNPAWHRITKNSIVRVLIEIARQLAIQVDAKNFRNEGDLLLAVVDELRRKFRELP